MSYQYQEMPVTVAAEATESERIGFIKLTYAHLGGAILLFVALSAAIRASGVAESMTASMLGSRGSWGVVLLLFIGVGWVAEYWAKHSTSTAMQYAGLTLYTVAEAIIFVPLLYIAETFYPGENIIATAGLITAIVFAGLTGVVFITKKDFSFMRGALAAMTMGALALIVASLVFGFSLGIVFCAAMVVLASGYILYYTSKVLHHYPIGSHVAAALALFSAVALLLWYVLRILMHLASKR